jgi:hypothetical protein
MSKPKKNWGKPGDSVTFTDFDKVERTEALQKERCWQCKRHSLVFYNAKENDPDTEIEHCLNGCGPRALCDMFKGFFS